MEVRHWGILLTIAGTFLLAFSLKINQQFDEKDKDIKAVYKQAQKDGFISLSGARIRALPFWGGLFCIAVGAILQW
jgi:hypothetical protein